MSIRNSLGSFIVVVTVAVASVLSCGNNEPTKPTETETELVVSLIDNSGCKNEFVLFEDTASNVECIDWSYDGNGTLSINHINAGFNCCVTSLTTKLTAANRIIVIDEGENLDNGGCRCLCLYDLEMTISPLSASENTFLIIGPYMDDQTTINLDYLLFTVDLSSKTEGTYCVERNHYPWYEYQTTDGRDL